MTSIEKVKTPTLREPLLLRRTLRERGTGRVSYAGSGSGIRRGQK